ncbi:hypothetical protein Smp_131470 [Schistosoma mansoni]|uniref:hypothetical protein n=1 Tax=Schistosoma mansoni TaxID=6183 RepID=UPI00022DC9D2|nr:hypothetical protein Smp_131470 [Schistosoma mansoni]|eukprot:XP_018655642.1 hypothetical protein Smp_131470 [Schistosoma mansoni]
MLHNCVIGKVINLWTQGVRYNLDRLQEASNNQRQYSNNKDIFTLNRHLLSSATDLDVCSRIITEISIQYNVFNTDVSLPLSLLLLLQTLFSTLAIASDATLYFEAIVNVMFGVSTVLCIAGAIALPFTVLKLLYEVKMVFGGGKFRYEQADLVLAAGVLYNCWWNLFLTLMWISSYSGLKNADTRNTTLPNVKSSVYGMILTK